MSRGIWGYRCGACKLLEKLFSKSLVTFGYYRCDSININFSVGSYRAALIQVTFVYTVLIFLAVCLLSSTFKQTILKEPEMTAIVIKNANQILKYFDERLFK